MSHCAGVSRIWAVSAPDIESVTGARPWKPCRHRDGSCWGAGLPGWCGSNAHVAFPDFRRLSQGIRASVPYHLAALDDGVLVGQLDKPLNVFVYDQGCLPHIAKLVQALPDLFANQGGQPFGRFIKSKQFWVGHQGAPNGQHLLFASGKLIAHVVCAFAQTRKQRKHAFECPGLIGSTAVASKGDKIFADRQVGEDMPAFGNYCNAKTCNAISAPAPDVVSVEADCPTTDGCQTKYGTHSGCFPHSVTSQQRGCLPRLDGQVDAKQYLAAAIGGFNGVDFEQRFHALTSSPK